MDGPVIPEPVHETTMESMEMITKRLELNWKKLRYSSWKFQFLSVVFFYELSDHYILKAEQPVRLGAIF